MAYSVNTTPTLETIPGIVEDFVVNTLGWSYVGPGEFRPTGMEGDLTFKIASFNSGGSTRYQERVTGSLLRSGVLVGNATTIFSPYINAAYQQPSRVFLHGGDSPAPYLGVVVEYDPGFFRHLYLGYLEKIGELEGGEVLGGGNFTKAANVSASYLDSRNTYPFGAAAGTNAPIDFTSKGGVRLRESGVESFLDFNLKTNTTSAATPGRVLGGFSDNYNKMYLANSQSPFSGASLLVPINLLRTLPESKFQPIGRPAGVRMVSMAGLDAGSVVTAGGKTWRCYPVFKKGPSTPVGANYPDESSYIVGQAYLVD